jgi:predicted TIM-barrel fold metal-dependent hydrolase
MPERCTYTMTDEDLATLLAACKPTPMMFLSGGQPMSPSPQENANAAWRRLGEKMGFDHMTVRPAGGDQKSFTAIPTNPHP